ELGEAGSELAGVVGDALGQATVVKSFASEGYEEKRLDKSLAKWSERQYKSWLSSVPSDMGRMFLAACVMAVLLLMTSRLYQNHTISIAIVALVQLYVVRLVTMTQSIADSIKTLETSIAGAYESMRTMQVEPTVVDAPDAHAYSAKATNNIEFKSTTF